jgi:uncharacterized protein YdhG (YjbR/CyaY superfamily)
MAKRSVTRARTGISTAARGKKTALSGDQSKRVEAYLAACPKDVRQKLQQLRALILATAPGALEWFSYGVPGFRLEGRPFIWYAAFTHHVSLYPMTTVIRTAFAKELEELETSKGTIRFPLERPLPVTLIKGLVKARLAEVKAAG